MPDAASDAGTTLPPKATPATATTLAPAAHGAPVPALRHPGEIAWLALAYGIDGFGYIITATFLPVIAREALPGSAWLDLFWPAFGAGIIVGALLSVRVPMRIDRRWLLVGCYAVQALAIAIPLWRPSLAGFAFGSLLLGLPFTAITFFAMQEVRRLRPTHAPSVMGLLTACYGIGQIVGPPLATWLLQHHASHRGGFALSLEIAAGSLLVGAAMFAAMARAYPSNRG